MTYPTILDRTDLPAVFRSVRRPRPNHALTGKPDTPTLIPYPQTPASAREWIRAHGLCQTELARRIGVSRLIVVDLLRGQLKGHRGDAHRAAIALGLKRDPASILQHAA
jgi:gp16 family phage-associated protein